MVRNEMKPVVCSLSQQQISSGDFIPGGIGSMSVSLEPSSDARREKYGLILTEEKLPELSSSTSKLVKLLLHNVTKQSQSVLTSL